MTPLVPLTDEAKKASLEALGLDADGLPTYLSAEEKRAAANPGLTASAPGVSPTGIPLIKGNSVFLKVAILVVALAETVKTADFFPSTTIDETLASWTVAIGVMLGISSSGIRKMLG